MATKTKEPGNKAVTTRNDQPRLPASMRQYANYGKEEIGREGYDIPRLKLLQGSSAEIETYDRAKPGLFFHTGDEHIFDKPFRIVPILYEQRFILWNPMESGGGILARADDGVHWSPPNAKFTVRLKNGKEVQWTTRATVAESGLDNFGTADPSDNKSPPAATRMLNYLVGFPDFPEVPPAVVTFKGASIKFGRKFGTSIKMNRWPMQGQIYEVWSEKTTNNANQAFYVVKRPSSAGVITEKDPKLMKLFTQYVGMYESLRGSALKVNLEDTLREDPTDEDDEPATVEGRANPRY